MSVADLFDTAIARLEAQDKKAFNPDFGVGAYRHEGACCLFGGMIEDEFYQPTMDAHQDEFGNVVAKSPVHKTSVLEAIQASTGVKLLDRLTLEDLQAIHDIHEVEWQPGISFKSLLPSKVSAKIWSAAAIQ